MAYGKTFTEHVDEANIEGLKIGSAAMMAAGIQPEFVAVNQLILKGMGSTLILRAGALPPVYNQPRGPKSGLNLTKTSNHSFFKGSIPEHALFTRLDGNMPIGHYKKDKERLDKPVKDPDYQHSVQLSVNMLDIIREVGPAGDLEILEYDVRSGQLRLGYKEGRGPKEFEGQFIINLNSGKPGELFYSRPWDDPKDAPDWDSENKMIKKPTPWLDKIPDEIYKKVFSQHFDLKYTDSKMPSPIREDALHPVKVFANTPRTPKELFAATTSDDPSHHLLDPFKESDNVSLLGVVLKLLTPDEIIKLYDRSARIVAGDWDGMALSSPLSLDEQFRQVYNTFEVDTSKQIAGMEELLLKTKFHLLELKQSSALKIPHQKDQKPRPFDGLIMGLLHFDQEIGDFALTRAGCITPHELLFQQLVNCAYRDSQCEHLGDEYNMGLIQDVTNEILEHFSKGPLPDRGIMESFIKTKLESFVKAKKLDPHLVDHLTEYLTKHVMIALQQGGSTYQVPHPQYDLNVQELYQHGFDMRNPYGCNLGGAWLMLTPEGSAIYGDTQEQLIEVMLIPGFLEKNLIDINHGADMHVGWHKVIAKQIELGQAIPEKTMESYLKYKQDRMRQEVSSARTDDIVPNTPGSPNI